MGKRKQKVRWSVIDGFQWSATEEEGQEENQGEPRQVWTTTLAPRFERKAAAEAEHAKNSVYYDGELCEAVELPNGFTKIRSKNLDILFKREYYEQRLAGTPGLKMEDGADEGDEENDDESETTDEEDADEAMNSEDKEVISNDVSETKTETSDDTEASSETTPTNAGPKTFYKMNPNDIPEFKPMNYHIEKDQAQGPTGQFYPPQYNHYPDANYPQPPMASPTPPRPNLYLYSPSSNALIPCEEIIIPNPIMGPDGPMYSGPTNIYLAYPVNGPDGRGYITQPFTPPIPPSHEQQFVQYNQSFSPTHSVDGSIYPSSSPNSANSGLNSGTSTLPSTPPPLVNYHPTNWIPQEQQPTVMLNNPCEKRPNRPQQEHLNNHHPSPCIQPAYTDPHLPPEHPVVSSQPSPNMDQPPSPPTVTNSNSAVTNGISAEARPFIPGLPPEILAPKKTQRRKKKKRPVEVTEHRGSTSSDTELGKITKIPTVSEDVTQNKDEPPTAKEMVEDYSLDCYESEPMKEVVLSDALAQSLVNPPNDEKEVELSDALAQSLVNPPNDDGQDENSKEKDLENFEDYTGDDVFVNKKDNSKENKVENCDVNTDDINSVKDNTVIKSDKELHTENNTLDTNRNHTETLNETAAKIVDTNCNPTFDHNKVSNPEVLEESKTTEIADCNLSEDVNFAITDIESVTIIETEKTENIVEKDVDAIEGVKTVTMETAGLSQNVDEQKTSDNLNMLRNDDDMEIQIEKNDSEVINKNHERNHEKIEDKVLAEGVNNDVSETIISEKIVEDDVISDKNLEQPPRHNKNMKRNRKKKLVLQNEKNASKITDNEKNASKITENAILIANTDTPNDSINKKLYRDACKTSLTVFSSQAQESGHNAEEELKPAIEDKPDSSVNVPATPSNVLNKSSKQEVDQTANVPLEASKTRHWEQNSNKRRNKKKRNNNSAVHFEEEVTVPVEILNEEPKMESSQNCNEDLQDLKKEEKSEKSTEVTSQETTSSVEESDILKEEDDEKEEKKKNKKRKKRQASEEPETNGRRVMICDSLVEIRLTRPVMRAKDILTSPQIQMAKQSGHLDFVIISELGCDMNKGSMSLDRLYKGKYIPPDRSDGLITKKIEEEEEEEKEEGDNPVAVNVGKEEDKMKEEEIDLD